MRVRGSFVRVHVSLLTHVVSRLYERHHRSCACHSRHRRHAIAAAAASSSSHRHGGSQSLGASQHLSRMCVWDLPSCSTANERSETAPASTRATTNWDDNGTSTTKHHTRELEASLRRAPPTQLLPTNRVLVSESLLPLGYLGCSTNLSFNLSSKLFIIIGRITVLLDLLLECRKADAVERTVSDKRSTVAGKLTLDVRQREVLQDAGAAMLQACEDLACGRLASRSSQGRLGHSITFIDARASNSGYSVVSSLPSRPGREIEPNTRGALHACRVQCDHGHHGPRELAHKGLVRVALGQVKLYQPCRTKTAIVRTEPPSTRMPSRLPSRSQRVRCFRYHMELCHLRCESKQLRSATRGQSYRVVLSRESQTSRCQSHLFRLRRSCSSVSNRTSERVSVAGLLLG